MRWTTLLAAGAAQVFLCAMVPGAILAQTCMGIPAERGGFTIGAGATVSDGAGGGFVHGRANLRGPLAFGSWIGLEERDEGTNAFIAGGSGTYEVVRGNLAVCPIGGFTHVLWNDRSGVEELSLSELTFPFGIGAGGHFALSGSSAVLPWVHSGLVYHRTRRSIPGSEVGDTVSSDSQVAFALSGGASLAVGRFFTRMGASTTTLDDSSVSLSLEFGLILAAGF
jgi:hypothetical protein